MWESIFFVQFFYRWYFSFLWKKKIIVAWDCVAISKYTRWTVCKKKKNWNPILDIPKHKSKNIKRKFHFVDKYYEIIN